MRVATFINTGLQPGAIAGCRQKPFQRFSSKEKPLKRLALEFAAYTRLKSGVNEMSITATRFCESSEGDERTLSAENGGSR